MERARPASEQPTQRNIFILLYALAWAGGAISYVPLLTILLPMRLTEMTGSDDVKWLAYLTFFGAIAASLANIGFGWASDVTRNRRRWIAAGLALNVSLLVLISRLSDPVSLIAAVVAWQVALNMMLAPLAALAADTVPDSQKGLLGGLLAFAPATGALAGAVVTIPGLASADGRILFVAAMVTAAVLPILLVGRPAAIAPSVRDDLDRTSGWGWQPRMLILMWLARLAIQIAEAALFAYLLFYFRAVDPAFDDADVARIFSVVLLVAAPLALATGRWADRRAHPIGPLAACAGIAALGLVLMASTIDLTPAVSGYVLFGLGSTVFLALHSSQTMRVLPKRERRGRDLGVFNLTNTVPSLVVPSLTLAIVPAFGYAPLMWILAGLAVAASLLLMSLPRLT